MHQTIHTLVCAATFFPSLFFDKVNLMFDETNETNETNMAFMAFMTSMAFTVKAHTPFGFSFGFGFCKKKNKFF
jgi:hypothetical protein